MLLVLAFLMPMQVYLAAVSGQVLDREGKPIVAALVTYKNIGTVNRNYHFDPGMRSENPTMTEGTGRFYQGKTDKKGAFSLFGLEYGVYEITITASDGKRVYSGRKIIGESSDPSSQNVLNVDLSAMEDTGLRVDPGGGSKLASGKKTKAQLDLIHQENARAVKINRLVDKYHAAVAVQDWVSGVPLLQQLIALDPHRWEFYQNLGTLQADLFQYQEAAQSYAQGVEVARKVLANASDTDHALTIIGDLLLAEADCYARLQKPEDATALYDKAAAVYPHPYIAHYRACNLLSNQDKPDQAIEKCNQAIADDATQWGPYQLLGSIYTMTGKPKDALEAYETGVATAQKSLEAQPDAAIVKSGLGQMLNSEGNLLLQLKRPDDAIAVFLQAAKVAVYPAMPYFNLCAIYYNLKRSQDALAACDQALLSDPTIADAYYIKGSILFGQGREDRGKYVVPPGTIESLNSYLKYAPSGDHSRVVQDMIKQTQATN